MAFINILAFCVLVLILSLYWREKVVDVLPMAACILILVLYLLAFLHRLSAIDGIGSVFLLLVLAWFIRQKGERRKQILTLIGKQLSHPGIFVAILLFVGTAFLVNGRIATWWDDLNFWATDVKALYALDGFAAKYTNAAPEFGDYPPGVQLMKWWFVHMKPEAFSEGLMFAGYYFCAFVFLMPLLRRMKGKNPIFLALTVICLWAFPSVAEVFYCQGMCADLVMAAVYGAFLAAVMDDKEHEKNFYVLRLALYLAVLVLMKSIGFLWAAFGLIFLLAWQLKNKGSDRFAKQADSPLKKSRRLKKRCILKTFLTVAAAPALTGGSWLLFCLLMRRVAKLTGATLSVAAGNLPILLPGTKGKLLAAFAEAFALWPLHRAKTWAIDLSPLAMFLMICILLAVYKKSGILDRAETMLLGLFLPISGLVFYGINLASHLTIFATETQYLDPYAMVSSIERYGAPFMIGSLYLIAYLLLERRETVAAGFLKDTKLQKIWRRDGVYLVCFAFVILTANWTEVRYGVYGYRAEREEALAVREEMITAESSQFLEKISKLDVGNGMRILYFRDALTDQWVKNTYVAFEASPVSLIFGSINSATMNSGDVWSAVDASHAGYLYLDEMSGDITELFATFTEEIEPHTLYRIEEEGGQVRLEKTEQ